MTRRLPARHDHRRIVVALLSKAESSFVELKNEFDTVQGRLNEEILVQVQEKLGLQKQVEELRAALDSLHGERSRGVELQDIFENRSAELELQLKQAQEVLESSETEKRYLVNQAEASLSESKSDFDLMQERLNGEISVQAQERQVLADQVEELKADLEALRGEQSRAIDLQDTLEKRVMDLELQLKQSNEAVERTEREKVEVNGVLSKVETNLSDLQTKFASVQERLNGKISIQAQEKQFLQSRTEELEAALAALRGERSRGLELQDVLEKRLMDYEQQLKQVQEVAEREKADIGELLKLQATLAALQSEKSRGVELQDGFDKLPFRDVVTWNGLIAGYTAHGQGQEAIQLFERTNMRVSLQEVLRSFAS